MGQVDRDDLAVFGQLLDAQLGLVEQAATVDGQLSAALEQPQRGLQRQVARFKLGHRLLEFQQGVLEGQDVYKRQAPDDGRRAPT